MACFGAVREPRSHLMAGGSDMVLSQQLFRYFLRNVRNDFKPCDGLGYRDKEKGQLEPFVRQDTSVEHSPSVNSHREEPIPDPRASRSCLRVSSVNGGVMP
jgi:hypothetical protein